MANFSFAQRGNNGILTYKAGSTHSAAVRIREASYQYSITSTESKSRLYRAFYPHRRALGVFTINIDCKGYKEFRQLQSWLRNYADTLQTAAMSSTGSPTLMHVRMPSRNFNRYGILVSGIEDRDHVGSMVFDVELHFMTLRDAHDSAISILTTDQVSTFRSPKIDPQDSLAFYPVSSSKYKDAQLYDDPDPSQGTPNPVKPPGGIGRSAG